MTVHLDPIPFPLCLLRLAELFLHHRMPATVHLVLLEGTCYSEILLQFDSLLFDINWGWVSCCTHINNPCRYSSSPKRTWLAAKELSGGATLAGTTAYFMFNVAPPKLHAKIHSPSPTLCPNLPTIPHLVLLTINIRGTEPSTTIPRCLQ